MGHLTLETMSLGSDLWISIADDGAGVDWGRVAEKARMLGLPASTQRDLDEALFASGVSTSSEVSETSGRGVGMDALRTACRELGGRVEVHSEQGRGTRITCVVPLQRASRSRRPTGGVSQLIPVIQ